MWFHGFPDGVRGHLYSYIRHPCADMIQAGPLCLHYVYQQHLPLCLYDVLRPSTLGSTNYGTIQRVGLSVGERNRMKRIE